MNWFNLKDLEQRLADDNISSKEEFYYLLANFILFAFIYIAAGRSQYDNPGVFVLLILIPAIGLFITFKANQKGDDKDYLKRILSLHWVVGIRVFVFAILFSIPVSFIISFISNAAVRGFLRGGYFAAAGIVFYIYLTRSIKKISNIKH